MPTTTLGWVLKGASHLAAPPAVILLFAQVGFAALSREAGFSLGQTVFMTLAVWALPSQVVFVGVVAAGSALPGVALAVALSAVRFLPMVMAWTPVVRQPTTPRWQLLALSWFVAVTAWVFAMARLPEVPRAARMPFFAGFGAGLTVLSIPVVALAYVGFGAIPPWAAAALVLLTPIYFLLALWGAARIPVDRMALAAGLVVGPAFSILAPAVDLIASGLVGGTLAYAASRVLARRRAVAAIDRKVAPEETR